MCGKYQLMLPFRELISLYGVSLADAFTCGLSDSERETECIERVDLRPTEEVLMDCGKAGSPSLKWARWGFPKLWKTEKNNPWKSQPLINTKAETALERVTWREATRTRRCLIPATGFYEWMKVNGDKYPLLFFTEKPLISFAGVWQEFSREDEAVTCVSIVTTAANDSVSDTHNRMPLILEESAHYDWLHTDDTPRLRFLLGSKPPPLSHRPVSTALNRGLCRDSSLLNADWDIHDVTTIQGTLW